MRFIATTTFVIAIASSASATPHVTLRTKAGAVYHGVLVSRDDAHVNLLLATGDIRSIAMSDLETSASPHEDDTTAQDVAPTRTVRTTEGSLFHGALIEAVRGDHVTIELANGRRRRIDWDEIDRRPPTSPQAPTNVEALPITVRTILGRTYDGEVIELVKRDHVAMLDHWVKREFRWEDIRSLTSPLMPLDQRPTTNTEVVKPRRVHERVTETTLVSFKTNDHALLERHITENEFETVCKDACDYKTVPSGDFRVFTDHAPMRVFPLMGPQNTVTATTAIPHGAALGKASTVVGVFEAIGAGLPLLVFGAIGQQSPNVAMAFVGGLAENANTGFFVANWVTHITAATFVVLGAFLKTRGAVVIQVNGVRIQPFRGSVSF